MPHDFARVVAPDGVGKVQGQILFGTPRVFRKLARQQRGRVGDHNSLFRQVLGELGVERNLLLRVFGNCFNDQVGVAKGFIVVGRELQVFHGRRHICLQAVDFFRAQI